MAKENEVPALRAMRVDLAKFLIDNALHIDVHFYTKDEWAARKETVGNNCELTMTFEGAFYHVYNHPSNPASSKLMWEFLELVKRHGYYAEQGYAWSLHFYPVPVVVPIQEVHEPERDPWGEDPEYPRKDWKHEVANDDTQLGYWDWVKHKKESDAGDKIKDKDQR